MAINYNKQTKLITIHTANTSYQMKVDELGVLLHTYYGPKIDDTDMSYMISMMDRGFSGNPYEAGMNRCYSLDVLPQEYSCFGTGDYRASALRVQNADGTQGSELRFVDAEVRQGKYALKGLPAVYADEQEAETLIVRMKDPYSGIEVELMYGVLAELDVITRAAMITNKGNTLVRLEKAAALSLDWQYEKFDWLTFYGRHTMERNLQRTEVHHGIQSIGSVRGTSSHQYNPFAVLCDKNATETSGGCYGFSFVYSGEFLMEVEYDQFHQTRLVCGIHPDNFSWNLAQGECFQTPEVVMVYSGEGFGLMSRQLHKVIREHICRGPWKNRRRPVLINNWEATYFDFTGEKLVSVAEEAAKMDIELFVMDDGWFGKRDDDYSGLGDWYPNEQKLGCTLKELGQRITATGMQFGIWFEPEAVSEDSNLYREHPEWAIQQPGRKPCRGRYELLLDYSRQDVQEYIIERLSAILTDAPISYVKWDMNRHICDKYSQLLGSEYQGEFSHRYVLGLYHVLETLYRRFPEVLFEGCSGGGGRFDAGMLYYSPQIWCSDNTDAIARLDIQYGTSFGYPVSSMGSHVSAVPNHQTGRVTPLSTRGCVAMAGTFGYELDVTKMTADEKAEVKQQIAAFHRFYPLIQYGDYYRLTTPREKYTAWEFVAPDGKEALVNAVVCGNESNDAPAHIWLQGLRENEMYRIAFIALNQNNEERMKQWNDKHQALSGAALMRGGLTLPSAWTEYQAMQLFIQAIDA